MTLDNASEINSPSIKSTTAPIYHEVQKPVISSDKFLDQSLTVDEMPNFFSFQGDEVRYGIGSLSKWSKATGDKETAGVIFKDSNDNLRFQDLSAGTEVGVNIFIHDLSQLPSIKAEQKLAEITHSYSSKKRNVFVLLSEDYPHSLEDSEYIKTVKGKRIIGSCHTHPSGNLPNGHDLAILLFDREETIKGVVAKDTHYLMVASKDAPNYEIRPTQDNRSTTMHDFGSKIDNEIARQIKLGRSPAKVMRKALIQHCELNKVGLYQGDIQDNLYRKIA